MILVGTSGYNYPEWKGSFYPAELPAAKMLPFYASKFPTVEINYTFYRMPTPKLIAGWRGDARLPSRVAMFLGTMPAIGAIRSSPCFAMELEDPVLGRKITHAYEIRALPLVS